MPRPKSEGGDATIALRIAHLRKLKGLSQKQLGEAIGVTFQQIQKYEKGVNRIAAERLLAIAQKLGVTVDQLTAREVQDNPVASTLSMSVVDTPGSAELLLAYKKISTPEMRQAALASVLAIAQTSIRLELATRATPEVGGVTPGAAVSPSKTTVPREAA